MKNSAANELKQVPVGYLVIGIDVHKKKHAAVIMPQDFTIRSKFKFNNSREGFEMALERARAEMMRTSSTGVIFAIETGGHYLSSFNQTNRQKVQSNKLASSEPSYYEHYSNTVTLGGIPAI